MAFHSLRHFLVAVLVLLSLATGATAAVQVRVNPAVSSGLIGSTITVTVEADSVADLGGFQFGFAYNSADLQALSATINPAFDNVVANDPGGATGNGMIAATVFDNPPQSGTPLTLATLEFRIMTPVAGNIALTNVILGQVGGAALPATAVDGTVSALIPSYAITASATPGGSITPSGSIIVNNNTTKQFAFAANPGFTFTGITGSCPVSSIASGTYTTGAITADCSVTATFADKTGPVMTLSTLADGVTTTSRVLNLTGSVTDVSGVASFTINGVDLLPQSSGFSHAIELAAGVNVITISATDSFDNATTITRSITCDPEAPALSVATPADLAQTAAVAVDVTGAIAAGNTVQVEVIDPVTGTVTDSRAAVVTATEYGATVGLANPFNTISVTVTDPATSATSSQKRTIVSRPGPSLAVTAPVADSLSSTGAMELAGTFGNAPEPLAIQIAIDGVTFTPPGSVTGDGTSPSSFSSSIELTQAQNWPVTVRAIKQSDSSVVAQVKRNIIYTFVDPVTSPTPLPAQTITGVMASGATVSGTTSTAVIGAASYPTATTWSLPVSGLTEGDNAITITVTENGKPDRTQTVVIARSADSGTPPTITAAAAANGSISSPGASSVTWGSSRTYTITPNAGFTVAALVVDGTLLPGATSYTFTSVTSDHYINAYFAPSTLTVTAAAGANGSISPAGATSFTPGSSQTYAITPDPGYTVALLVVDGAILPGATTHTFTNIASDHYINAYFTPIPTVTITAAAAPNGGISSPGAVQVAGGTNKTYTITPDPGFMVAALVVDGAQLPGATTYTFTNVASDHYINAYFTPIPNVTITAAAAPNGSISSPGAVQVAGGADKTYTITPDPGYTVAALVVDGVLLPGTTTYTFTNVTEDHYINAYFQ